MNDKSKGYLCKLLHDVENVTIGDMHKCETCVIACVTASNGETKHEFIALYDPVTSMLSLVSMKIGEVVMKVFDKGYIYYCDDDYAATHEEKQQYIQLYENMKKDWEEGA